MYLSNRNKYKIYYLFYKNKSTNKLKKITTNTKVKAEALEFIRTFNPDAKKTEILKEETKDIFFSDLQSVLMTFSTENFSPCTTQIYRNTTNYFLKIIGNKLLKDITITDIENFKSERLKIVNKVTANIDIRALKAAFNKAITWKMLEENPCQYVQFYTIPEEEILCFEDKDLEILLDLIDDKMLTDIILLAMYTGCRITEILNLQWNDIDFNSKILTIRNKANFKTKSGRIRQIPISEKLMPVLNNLFNNRYTEKDNIFKMENPQDYLFANKNGINYKYTWITMRFKKYLRKAGLDEKLHFHCLRHTFITNLIKKGVNINYVMEIAGHSDIGTTMNYIHIETEDLREAVNMI
jgi:integrase